MPRPSAGSRYSAAAGMAGMAGMAIGESPSKPGRRVSGLAMVGPFHQRAMTLARGMPGGALMPRATTMVPFNY